MMRAGTTELNCQASRNRSEELGLDGDGCPFMRSVCTPSEITQPVSLLFVPVLSPQLPLRLSYRDSGASHRGDNQGTIGRWRLSRRLSGPTLLACDDSIPFPVCAAIAGTGRVRKFNKDRSTVCEALRKIRAKVTSLDKKVIV